MRKPPDISISAELIKERYLVKRNLSGALGKNFVFEQFPPLGSYLAVTTAS
jgi:hypothetical protein